MGTKNPRPAHRPAQKILGGLSRRAVNRAAVAAVVFDHMRADSTLSRSAASRASSLWFKQRGVTLSAKQITNLLDDLLVHINRRRDAAGESRLALSTPADWDAFVVWHSEPEMPDPFAILQSFPSKRS